MYLDIIQVYPLFRIMAETKSKSKYNFGGHEFDAELYLQNLKDNAQGYLDSRSDWSDAQKEEWKHSYTNFTNALAQDIKDGTGRFSTDEFGTITDTKGEFSNTDSDNYYYNDKGEQISSDDYNKLKDKKKQNYSGFDSNKWFATYANQIGTALRDKLKAKETATTEASDTFDYKKNGFDSFWNKKHNPANEEVDASTYWKLDADGKYTNRIASAVADIDEYLKRDDLPDNVKANVEAYKNQLLKYQDQKDFDVEGWKNNTYLSAVQAGLGTWNNNFFNMGKAAATDSNQPKDFDINDDEQALAYGGFTEQARAHPKERAALLAMARRKYAAEGKAISDQNDAELKEEQEVANNKIWETYLANNPYIKDVTRRIGRSGTGVHDTGRHSIKKDENYVSQTMFTQDEQDKANANINYTPQLRKEVQAALKGANWANADDPLLQTLDGVTTTNGLSLNTLGKWYQYNWNTLMSRRNVGAMNGWTAYKDATKKNEVWRRDDSYRAKDGTYLYMFNKNGKIYTYRSKPYDKLRADVVAKGQLGMSIRTKNAQQAAEAREAHKVQVSAQTAKDKDRTAQEQKNMEREGFTGTDIARLAGIGMDLGSVVAAATGPETLGAGTLVSAGLGVGSTATNFVADLVDGENLGNAAWTAAEGLGMDALGLIPGAGAASKTGKIYKTLIRYVPRLLAAYGAYEGYENMPYIVNSTKKLVTPGAKMTVDDYRNIAQGIGLVTGAVSAGARKSRGQKKASDFQTTKQQNDYLRGGKNWKGDGPGTRRINMDNEVALNFKDKNGKKVTKTFSGEDAEKIRNASSNKEINEVLANYDLKDLTLDTRKSLRPHFQWIRSENKKWQSPVHRGDVTATRYDIYKNGKGEVYTNASGLRGWLDPVYDKKSSMSVAQKNSQQNPTPTGHKFSIAELREIVNQTSGLKKEWKGANKADIANARGKAEAAENNAKNATDATEKQRWEDLAKRWRDSYLKTQTEYNRLRSLVDKNGNLTFDVGTGASKHKIEVSWNDILKKYGIKYKQGGSIRKFVWGGGMNGNPMDALRSLPEFNVKDYTAKYTGNQVGMQEDGTYGDAYGSPGMGNGEDRYQTDAKQGGFSNDRRNAIKTNIENQQSYKAYTDRLLADADKYLKADVLGRANMDTNNNEFLYWASEFDKQFVDRTDPSKQDWTNKGRFFSAPGVLNRTWEQKNKDSYNQGPGNQTDLLARIKAVRNDQQLGRGHDDRRLEGTRYYWMDNGTKRWLSEDQVNGLGKEYAKTSRGDVVDGITTWHDYEITAPSKVDIAKDKTKPEAENTFSLADTLRQIGPTDRFGLPRALFADNTNRKVTDLLKTHPLLIDPQENHRYIKSDLDTEINGEATAGQYNHFAEQPISTSAEVQTQAALDAFSKGQDARTTARQTSNQVERASEEANWTQEVQNDTNRHQAEMTNRESIHTAEEKNKSLEAANLNQHFTVWDTLAQEKELEAKQDYETAKARIDARAQTEIEAKAKSRMMTGQDMKTYGLNDADIKLYNDVYTNGTKTTTEIAADPALRMQWNKIQEAFERMKTDMVYDYYGVPRSKYWYSRANSKGAFGPTITTSVSEKKKQGGCLNTKKVRAAAKGEKLAAAQLKAQTADADRFYKTTKDHIDRMYDAIARVMDYSGTKKKRKKKS